MKDKQIIRKAESGSILLISPVLHVFTVPVIVFLRADFGLLFLRPKSIFLSLIWAFLLFGIYSFFQPRTWQGNKLLFWFLALASLLYLFHLVRAVISQIGAAPHDQFAGDSNFRFLPIKEERLHLWGEPLLVLLAALVLLLVGSDDALINYFGLAACALLIKEIINQWYSLRKVKQQLDATADAEESMGKVVEKREPAVGQADERPLTASRMPRQRRERARGKAKPDATEAHAATLRLMPPYSLEQVETNFRVLVTEQNRDVGKPDEETSKKLRVLNEARDFFREYFAQ